MTIDNTQHRSISRRRTFQCVGRQLLVLCSFLCVDWSIFAADPMQENNIRPLGTLDTPRDVAIAMSISNDNKWLVSIFSNRTVGLYSIAKKKEAGLIWRGEDVVHSVAFSSTSPMLATFHEDGMVRIWNPETLKIQAQHQLDAPVSSSLFCKDSNTIAVAMGRSFGFLDMETFVFRKSLDLDFRAIICMGLSPDGKLLAIGDRDYGGNHDVIQVIDVVLRKSLFKLHDPKLLPERYRFVVDLGFSGDGRQLVASYGHTGDSRLAVWDLDVRRLMTAIEPDSGRIGAVTFLDDRFLSASDEIVLWKAKSGKRLEVIQIQQHDLEHHFWCGTRSPDRAVWAVSRQGEILLWHVEPTD